MFFLKKEIPFTCLFLIIGLVTCIIACDDGDTKPDDQKIRASGLITSFDFEEVTPVDTRIIQPADNSGVGVIEVLLPAKTADLMLTPKQANFNTAAFTVNPDPAIAQDFSEPVTYILTSKENTEITLRYDVTVAVSETDPDMREAFLESFRFNDLSTSRTLVDVFQDPVLEDGVETETGVIHLLLTGALDDLVFTPSQSNFDVEGFTISPQLGIATDFSSPVAYTITADGTDRAIHYTVSVEPISTELPEITAFRFEKANNPDLANDIEATEFISDIKGNRIYVFVPEGTDLSALHATVEYEGQTLEYAAPNPFTDYPVAGADLDYKYPNHVRFQAGNPYSTGDVIRTYDVIVALENPVMFEESTSNIGEVNGTELWKNVTNVTNRGNHKLILKTISINPNGTILSMLDVTALPVVIAPGESYRVQVAIDKGSHPAGDYEATWTLAPRIYLGDTQLGDDDFFNRSTLTIQATLVDP